MKTNAGHMSEALTGKLELGQVQGAVNWQLSQA